MKYEEIQLSTLQHSYHIATYAHDMNVLKNLKSYYPKVGNYIYASTFQREYAII